MAFRDIIGHDRAIRIIIGTLQRGRIASSYLFAGESGIGKKLAAINLAKALNCLGGEQRAKGTHSVSALPHWREQERGGDSEFIHFDACDTCSACKKIDANIHPDFRLIVPDSGQIKIDEIRAIEDVLSFKAYEGSYKVVIVDDAETMNQSAANAFLKTLEEPPKHSIIILISANPDLLPETVRSRCSRINFMPLPPAACKEVIRRGLQAPPERGKKSKKDSRPAISDAHIEIISWLSMGKPGNALSEDLVEQRTRFLEQLKEMSNLDKDSWSSREEMEKWFSFILTLLRDIAVMKITRNDRQLVNADLTEYVSEVSKAIDIKGIIELYQRLNTLKNLIHFNLNKSLTWNYTGSLLRKYIGGLYA